MLLWQSEIIESGTEENAEKDQGLGFYIILMVKQEGQSG